MGHNMFSTYKNTRGRGKYCIARCRGVLHYAHVMPKNNEVSLPGGEQVAFVGGAIERIFISLSDVR
jgi:hypothetical protein